MFILRIIAVLSNYFGSKINMYQFLHINTPF
jgi:hypothetical protein